MANLCSLTFEIASKPLLKEEKVSLFQSEMRKIVSKNQHCLEEYGDSLMPRKWPITTKSKRFLNFSHPILDGITEELRVVIIPVWKLGWDGRVEDVKNPCN